MSLNAITIGHLGNTKEISNLTLFLASDDSNDMNGTEVYIDGKWTVGR